jgi:hypothetical protein
VSCFQPAHLRHIKPHPIALSGSVFFPQSGKLLLPPSNLKNIRQHTHPRDSSLQLLPATATMSLSDINPQIDPGSDAVASDVGSAPTTNGNSIKDTAVNSEVCDGGNSSKEI